MTKSVITVTCCIITYLVVKLRKIDRRQLYGREGYSYIMDFIEGLFLMCHIPPHNFGFFSPQDDVWNVLGTTKFYLLTELFKLRHTLWKRRYDINAARLEANRPPFLIGSFFCLTATLSQLDPVVFFILIMLLFLGMFMVWIFFMERSHENFDIMIMIDHILSSFFSVPPANHHA